MADSAVGSSDVSYDEEAARDTGKSSRRTHVDDGAPGRSSSKPISAWRGVVGDPAAQPESLATIRHIVDSKKQELDDLLSYLQDAVESSYKVVR
jgi:hypothetical protein